METNYRVTYDRPETVTVDGRVQAWLLGSGTEWMSADAAAATDKSTAVV